MMGGIARELLQLSSSSPGPFSPQMPSPFGNYGPPNPYNPNVNSSGASFKPSIAVIIGVLTTMFSLTFLLLLYAKHCKRSPNIGPEESFRPQGRIERLRTDAGIDPSVVEALPMFTFGSLQGLKEGLECAVCLSKFEEADILRLLPKCKHAFHLDCVDIWLSSHSTCPLCRQSIRTGDELAVEEALYLQRPPITSEEALQEAGIATGPRNSAVATATASQPSVTHESALVVIERTFSGRSAQVEGEVPKGSEVIARKDGLLLGGEGQGDSQGAGSGWGAFLRKSFESSISPGPRGGGGRFWLRAPSPSSESSGRRVGHKIIIADVVLQQRWSDFVPSDVLFLHTQTLFGPEEKARVSISKNDFFNAASPISFPRDCVGTGDTPCTHTHKKAGRNQQDLELGLELSSGLPQGKPSKSIKLDFEANASFARLTRGSSQKSTEGENVAANNEEVEIYRPSFQFQRSMSEITGLGRISHNRISSRDLLLAGSSSTQELQTEGEQEKSKKWSSIARKTLNWLLRSSRDKRGMV